MVGLFMKNTTLCGKILHFVVNYSFLWYNITFLGYNITFCSTFVVFWWYICDIFVIFFAMGFCAQIKLFCETFNLSEYFQVVRENINISFDLVRTRQKQLKNFLTSGAENATLEQSQTVDGQNI